MHHDGRPRTAGHIRHNRTVFGTVLAAGDGCVKFREQVYELALDNHGLVTTARAATTGAPAVELRKLAQRMP